MACRAGQASLAAQMSRAANATSHARWHVPLPGDPMARAVDPTLAKAFTRARAGLWATTGACQHFYRKEFALAHERDARLARRLGDVESMLAPTHTHTRAPEAPTVDTMRQDMTHWLDAIVATGNRGWHFRAARDAVSLAGNLSLLAVIAACFHQQMTADEATAATGRGVDAANTPFGVPWADWTLLAFEGAKGVITQSLGSPTLIRHHAVDEVLKRLDAGCRLLEACVMGPPWAAASSHSSWRDTLGSLTRARDVATLFTFANSAVPPARLGLWVPSWFSGTSDETRELGGYRGILRVAGLMLDSCRAVTSLLGTWARNQAFVSDAQDLTQRWQHLCLRLADVPENCHTTVLERVARVAQMSMYCDTALLAKIATHDRLRERLLTSCDDLQADQISLACQQFSVPCHPSRVDGADHLSLRPAESPWGQRWAEGRWASVAVTPMRASYRLLLLYQHWSAALLERVMGASSCRADERTTASPTSEPAGIGRTPSGIAYFELESMPVSGRGRTDARLPDTQV
ncbi:hypothetical protein [Pandoraea pnomenusa]|uniref:hypothetical protein n=1 Tax=Pandoraea pnomenusa TaxID=93220 RepID=UPI00333E6CF9